MIPIKRAISLLALIVLVTAGCAATRAQTTVPAGPIQAATNEDNMIPAGTELAILTNENISSSEAGRTFDAEVARDITNESGQLLLAKGSPVELVILQTDTGGAVGTPTVELGIRSVTIDGQKHNISTAAVTEEGDEGLGANRRTAEMVGGGAALGTLIGAVTGGGQGALIGAAAGAAVGAAAQVYTRGEEVRVPAETMLSFRLSQPLEWGDLAASN